MRKLFGSSDQLFFPPQLFNNLWRKFQRNMIELRWRWCGSCLLLPHHRLERSFSILWCQQCEFYLGHFAVYFIVKFIPTRIHTVTAEIHLISFKEDGWIRIISLWEQLHLPRRPKTRVYTNTNEIRFNYGVDTWFYHSCVLGWWFSILSRSLW